MSVAENVRNYSLIQFVVTTCKYNYQNYITSKDIIVLYIHKKKLTMKRSQLKSYLDLKSYPQNIIIQASHKNKLFWQ